MEKQIKVLAFAGSLRKGSYNKALMPPPSKLLRQMLQLKFSIWKAFHLLTKILKLTPPQEFKEKIRNADALLIATPEYNYSVLGSPQKRP